jgi:hypothetical protein
MDVNAYSSDVAVPCNEPVKDVAVNDPLSIWYPPYT